MCLNLLSIHWSQEEFQMIGRTLREKTSGSGLKMSITKQLTVAHGGEIFESSKLGHGTEIVRRFRL